MDRQSHHGRAARFLKRAGVALSALAAASMSATPVSAQVGQELNDFFDDMGASANATGPTAYQGQSAGYYSGGNIWTRFPQKSVNPVNLQLPSIKAGCGGIDVFSGSFSFINSDEINAFALPGGKVFFTKGLALRLTNEAQMAGVLGHEIGHVTAEHADKHISQAMILNGGVAITGAVLGDGGTGTQLAMQALETSAGLFALKFSRSDELEADRLGMRYMRKAGYDPRGLRGVMELFLELSAGGRQPEFLSTHPDPQRRIEQIDEKTKNLGDTTLRIDEERFQREFLQPLRAKFGGASVSAVDVETPTPPAVWCALCSHH